jgi:hypothetical protein
LKIDGKLTPLFATFSLLLVPYSGAATVSDCAGEKILYSYPIVMTGPTQLFGAGVDSIRAAAFTKGSWKDIPIQVEEVNAAGDYVLVGGQPFTRYTDDGLFDEKDEVALMGEDLGDDFALEDVPAEFKQRALSSWKVKFCRGGKLAGHMLLQTQYVSHKADSKSYVTYDGGQLSVGSDLYEYKFHPKNPVLLGEVALKKDGKKISVIESSQYLMPLRTPFFMPNMVFKDSDFTSTIESWQSGPIRTIIAVGVKYTSFLSLFKLHLFSELVFYRNRFVIPTKIEFIFSPRSLLKSGSGVSYVLKLPAEQGWKFESNLASFPGMSPDEYMKTGPKALSQEEFYVIASGRDGALIASVRVDEAARAMVPMPLMLKAADFLADENKKDWPWMARQNGDLGVFIDFSNVEKGMYNFGLDLLLSTRADERFADYGSVDMFWHRVP